MISATCRAARRRHRRRASARSTSCAAPGSASKARRRAASPTCSRSSSPRTWSRSSTPRSPTRRPTGLTLTAGQHNNFQSLDELTSSRFSSLHRAGRLHRRVQLRAAARPLRAPMSHGPADRAARRLPRQSARHRRDRRRGQRRRPARLRAAARRHPAPSRRLGPLARQWRSGRGTTTRYRQRPLLHATDVRFIGTPGACRWTAKPASGSRRR